MKRFMATWLVAAAMFLNGCATTYTGSGPNFKASGAEATREIERFTAHPSFWLNSNAVIQMGPEKTLYQTQSLMPTINTVSPETVTMLDRARTWNQVGLVLLSVSLAVLLTSDAKTFNQSQGTFWTFWGAGFAASIVSNVMSDNAFDRYNQDLKQKFAPQLSYRVDY